MSTQPVSRPGAATTPYNDIPLNSRTTIQDLPNNTGSHYNYYGQTKSENGHTFYCAFEKVDALNLNYWEQYKYWAGRMVRPYGGLCNSVIKNESLSYPNTFSDMFNYTEEHYNDIVKFIQKKGLSLKIAFAEISNGINGMDQVLSSSTEIKKIFMNYASTIPVLKHHDSSAITKPISTPADYNEIFGNVIMSHVFLTEDNSPTVTHYGIFRNPPSFLDTEQKYRDIAMKVHGYAALMALTHFSGKKYMVTAPTSSKLGFLTKYLGRGDIHIGTNKDLKSFASDEKKELLKKFPPILHIDQKTGIEKIAKEGTDLSEYLDYLPDEKAEFIAPQGRSFNYAGETWGGIITVINLEKLAEFYSKDQEG